MLMAMSERFLPATLLAYGPRFVLLLPLLVLVPWAIGWVRSALLPLSLAAAIAVGPIMGGRVSWRTLGRPLPGAPAPGQLRVLSYNTFGGSSVAARLDEALALRPDLIAFQECSEALVDALRRRTRMYVISYFNLCTASRWPITSLDSMPRGDLARISQYGFGGSALVLRHLIKGPYGPLIFVNVHLETARKGLQAFTNGDGLLPDDIRGLGRFANAAPDAEATAAERLNINTRIRDRESERASLWAVRGDKAIPVIVAGDFNLPVESTIFHRHWDAFTDAFEAVGTGFGWTKREGTLLRIRIDHVLGNATAPKPAGVWLGPDLGSDHLPVIADLRWP